MGDDPRLPKDLILLGVDSTELRSFSVAPVVARMCKEAGWGFDLFLVQPGPGQHFGGGSADVCRAMGSSFVGGRHADQIRTLCESFHVRALGKFSHAATQTLARFGVQPYPLLSNGGLELLTYVARLLDLDLPRCLYILDASPQGRFRINTAAYQYPSLFRAPCLAIDISEYHEFYDAFIRLGIAEHEALYVGGPVGRLTVPSGPRLGGASYAEFTSSIALSHKDWAEGLLLADPNLVLSSLPRASDMRLVPLYGRPQVDALRRIGSSPRWSVNGAWGRQFDDRDFEPLGEFGVSFQLIDAGPPLHAVAVAATRSEVRRLSDRSPHQPAAVCDSIEQTVADEQLVEWAKEGRKLTSLIFWCGMVREIEAVERVADLVAMTGLKAGIALTVTAVRHMTQDLSAILSSCDDAGGRLEPLLASCGDGIAFEYRLGGTDFGAHLSRMRSNLQMMSGRSVNGWWPLLDGPPVSIRRRPKLREGRLVPPLQFAGRMDEDRPSIEARLFARTFRFRVMQARPAEWIRPNPPSPELLRAVAEGGFTYLVSKSTGERQAATKARPVVLPASAPWSGWTPFRVVATASDFRRIERRLQVREAAGTIVASVDTALALQSGEAWRSAPQLFELASYVASGGDSRQLINVPPEVLARYRALIDCHLGPGHPDA